MSIGEDWNLISRTIVPIIRQEDMRPGAGRQSGVGDATQSLFFSPKALTAGGWTYGALANHIIDTTFLQPFVAKRIGPGRTVSMNVESTYDWERDASTAPVNVGISQILPIGKQLVSLQAGGAYYAEAPRSAPEWGARLTVTFLYPKR